MDRDQQRIAGHKAINLTVWEEEFVHQIYTEGTARDGVDCFAPDRNILKSNENRNCLNYDERIAVGNRVVKQDICIQCIKKRTSQKDNNGNGALSGGASFAAMHPAIRTEEIHQYEIDQRVSVSASLIADRA